MHVPRFFLLWFILLAGAARLLFAQGDIPVGCKANASGVADADAALYLEDWGKAARLYHEELGKDPASIPARAGLVRVMLGQGHINDALREATAVTSQHPDSVVAQTVLAETYLRRGELAPATPIPGSALTADRCYARAHLQEARLQNLSGYHASAAHHWSRPMHSIQAMSRSRWRGCSALLPRNVSQS